MNHGKTVSLGNGFHDHGVATPISNHRGTVATVDGDGRNVALVWLFDHRGGYALLMIDAETGRTDEVPMPFDSGGDCPFASILSSRNRFYTHFNSHFAEFDPAARAFTFHHATVPQMAMAMTEDDAGRIWSGTYPDCGVACYDPRAEQFTDFGHVYDQDWPEYPRAIAADDTGWIYFAIGPTSSQILTLDPESGKVQPILAESDRRRGYGSVRRDMNGKVYGQALAGDDENWIELYRGEATPIGRRDSRNDKPIIAESQGLFHRAFPDGRMLERCDLTERVLAVSDPDTGDVHEVAFDYSSDGAHLMGVAAAPDETLCGGTAFPMRFFSYDPKQDEWINRVGRDQWNTVARAGDRFFIGAYIHGALKEWDPSQPWTGTEPGCADSNPREWVQCAPTINRPHNLLIHPDGRTVVLAGTPDYGYTGGGLLFFDRQTHDHTLLEHTDILPDHSTMSMVALPDGKLLGGTTIAAGTGGQVIATEAELYIMDPATKRIEWHAPLLQGVPEYTDMALAPSGMVYSIVAAERFVVFDPQARQIVHEADLKEPYGGAMYQQGPRKILTDPHDNATYLLLSQSIVQVEPKTYELTLVAESPVAANVGGDVHDGRIYFGNASHLYSYELPR